ncbi:MAG: Cna B-type domain-containing protein [Clostridiales bacterium]|nr:Cna B-type domain-containing protein [Clostridiales bacterium]
MSARQWIHRHYLLFRRTLAWLMITVMMITNVGANVTSTFAAGEEESALFLVDGQELREAIEDAKESGTQFRYASLYLTADKSSKKGAYSKLLGGKGADVYELDVDVDDSYAPEGTELRLFYNDTTEDVIFLFVNETESEIMFRANVDGYETARLSVKPYETEGEGVDPVEIDATPANASVSVHETNLVGIAIDDGESETTEDAAEELLLTEEEDEIEIVLEEEAEADEEEEAAEDVEEIEETGEEEITETEEAEPEEETVETAEETETEEIAVTVGEAETTEEASVTAEEETKAAAETTETIVEPETEEETGAPEIVILTDEEEQETDEPEVSNPSEVTILPDEEYLLEDESIQNFGTLKGKALSTVLLSNSATARALRISLADLTEIIGTAEEEEYPAFEQSKELGGVTVSVTAEEGVLPEGTSLEVEDVTEELQEALIEKLNEELGIEEETLADEDEAEAGYQAGDMLLYRVRLTLDGEELDGSWAENGSVQVSFSGAQVGELADDDGTVQVLSLDEESAQITADDLSYETVAVAAVDDGSVSFETDDVTTYAVTAPGPGGQLPGPQTQTTVDHIDIGIEATATLEVNGEKLTQEVTLTRSDFENGNLTITATQNGESVTYTQSSYSSSTGSSGVEQIRINGTYPVGTKENPVVYTVTLTKDVTFTDSNGNTYTVTVTFTASFNYWDENNDCPGLENSTTEWQQGSVIQGSGMDFLLGADDTESMQTITITKEIVDAEGNPITLEDGQTYTFYLYSYDENTGTSVLADTITVTVAAGESSQIVITMSAALTPGTYYLMEEPVETVNDTLQFRSVSYAIDDGESTEAADDYKSGVFTISEGGAVSVTATNVYTEDTTELTVNKVWVDGGNTNQSRPESITVTLYQNDEIYGEPVTLTETDSWDSWSYTWTGLPGTDTEGTAYIYTVQEEAVEGYTGDAVSLPASFEDGVATITNTIEDLMNESISGTKTWVDGGKLHDNNTEITLKLYRTSAKEGSTEEEVTGFTVDWTDNTYTISGLDQYDEEGYPYTYRIGEVRVSGYQDGVVDGYNITNTIEDPMDAFITGTKTWKDGSSSLTHANAEEVKLTLYRQTTEDGSDKEEVTDDYSVAWMDEDGDGYAETWTISGLKTYDATGQKYIYSVEEEAIEGYSTVINGESIINTRTEKTEVSGTKTWKDSSFLSWLFHDNENEVTLTLWRSTDGENYVRVTNATPEWSGNTYTFSDLDVFDEDGNLYDYKVTEGSVPGYKSTSDGNNFTNTETGDSTVDVTGTKIWVDGGLEHDNKTDVTLVLKRTWWYSALWGNEETVNAEPTWEGDTYTFSNLDKYYKTFFGTWKYHYTVVEVSVPEQYTSTINGYNIINRLKDIDDTITITGNKTWIDGERIHDSSVEVSLELYRKASGSNAEPVLVSAQAVWDGDTYSFEGLSKYDENGSLYVYTVREISVTGYESSCDGYDIINTIVDPEDKVVTGRKVWSGEDETATHSNATEVKLILYRKASGSDWATVSDAEAVWDGDTFTFTGLERYEDETGYEYRYCVKEEISADSAYAMSQSGTTITNTLRKGTFSAEVVKWLNGGLLTEGQFTFELYDADGNLLATASNAAGENLGSDISRASVMFEDIPLPRYEGEKTYTYHIVEVNDGKEGYTYSGKTVYVNVTVGLDETDPTKIVATTTQYTDSITEEAAGLVGLASEEVSNTFVNTYEAPGTPEDPDTPGTGEDPGNPEEPENPDTPDTPSGGGGGGAGGTDATGSFTPTFVKYITGRSFRSTDTFTFALVKTAPDGTVTTESVTITPEAGAYSYSGTFGTDTFTEDDIGLTYTYVISEEEGDISRMTYDTTEYTVEVTITDDGDDDLTVTALLDDGTEFDTAEFTNRYYSSSSGGGGGSSGGGSSSSSSSTASTSGGPGTTSGSSSDGSSGSGSGDPASPSDADLFLGALPKTGVDSSDGVLFILTGMTLVAYVLISRRKEEEE